MPTAAQPLIDTLSGDMPDLLRPIKVQKRCASAGPILQVKSGSVTVPVYRCGDGRLPRFFIAYYRNGQRVRQSFSTIDEAKREAQVAARQIAAGLAKATGLSIAEREAYDAAKAILEAAGIPLLSAVEEYAQCRKILEGKSLLAAVSDYAQRNKGVRIGAKLPDLIEEFLAAKKQDGASDRYLYQLKSDVKRFAEAFPLPILHIKSHQIDEWLRKLGGAPRTRNTVHTSIRTFFSWAKARSYLPKNETTEAEAVSKVKVGDTETGIFTPAQIKSLLAIATPEMIPFIAIGAFAGLRAAEIARLDWSAVDLKRKIIHLRADQAKTASRRIIPVSDNLRAWLLPRVGKGRVVPNAEMQKKVAPLARILGFEWPNNVLRHSFISYRIAIVKSAEQVALEAGNSPTIIFKHYRELATEEQANEWFGIFPLPPVLSAF